VLVWRHRDRASVVLLRPSLCVDRIGTTAREGRDGREAPSTTAFI
jgi:hypothetical protein